MSNVDVCILGGGLAGLSLAIQLKRALADIQVMVLERVKHPVREAAFKVGESTVEVGAHYFAEQLGLKDHILDHQLPKLGLRFFFDGGDNSDISRRVELGGTMFSPTPSYQLDRGRFENYLGEEARRLGIKFFDDANICAIELDRKNGHHVSWHTGSGQTYSVKTRWVIDATGRASFLKRKKRLHESTKHHANAVWFRINERIKIDDWTDNPRWLGRTGAQGAQRWLSTNHLMGRGYWVWLIPLASGATSVGIVCDAELHDFESMNSFKKTLVWMEKHEPQCAKSVEKHQDKLLDFIGFRDYSYRCKQVFSPDRWCLTGEAGVFLDPFYSPGSDFIAMSNTFITDMIIKDCQGERVTTIAGVYNDIFMQFFDRQLQLYQGQYAIFGNSRFMPLKILWDFIYYWSIPAFIFFQKRLCDLSMYTACNPLLQDAARLNNEMQSYFRMNGRVETIPLEDRFVDITRNSLLVKLNQQLTEVISVTDFIPRMEQNIRQLEQAAAELKVFGQVRSRGPKSMGTSLRSEEWFSETGQLLFG